MVRRIFRKRLISLGLVGCLLFGMTASVFTADVQAAGIVVDGNLADWTSIPKQDSADGSVPYWFVAQDADYLYFSGHDINGTSWYRPLVQQTVIFTYANNGATGENSYKQQIGLSFDNERLTVIDYSSREVLGATAVCRNTAGTGWEANMENDYEWRLPKSFLADTQGSLTFCGIIVSIKDIPWLDGGAVPEVPEEPEEPEMPEEPEESEVPAESGESKEPEGSEQPEMPAESETKPAYQGIVIDGKFADWDAVEKTPIHEKKEHNTVDEVAMVWDGDSVYLYFMAKGNGDCTGHWGSVTRSGPHNSGQFVIRTDLGKELLIQLCDKNGGSVKGVEGAKVAVNNKKWGGAPFMWEVSIPTSALPEYNSTISFGIYQGDMVISDVANLQSSDISEEEVFSGITIDGLYGDWKCYPHTMIRRKTQCTKRPRDCGEGALCVQEDKLYAHVTTGMRSYQQGLGSELTRGITIRLNNDTYFYPQVIAVDAQGNINYHPQMRCLPRGTYEFYLIDRDGGKTATNISELEACNNALYGHMYVTTGATVDDMEFEMDLELVAKKFGMEASDIKTVEGQWLCVGPQWISTAGTSTGTWAGLLICFVGVEGATYIQRKRKKNA